MGRTTAFRVAQRYGLGRGPGKGRGREVAAVGQRADRLAGGRAEEVRRRPQLRGQPGRAEDSRRAGLPGTPLSPPLYLSLMKKGATWGAWRALSLFRFL